MNSYQKLKNKLKLVERQCAILHNDLQELVHRPNSDAAREILKERKKQIYYPNFSKALIKMYASASTIKY